MAGISPKLPLSIDTGDGFKLNKTFKQVAKQNLKMLILTSPGERMMIPNFGVGLRRYLFENATSETFDAIRTKVKEQVQIYMPYINIIAVNFISESETDPSTRILEGTVPSNFLHMTIEYSIASVFISDKLTIKL